MTADLIERLRDAAQESHAEAWRRVDGGQCLTISAMLAEEAADAIEALTARATASEAALARTEANRDAVLADLHEAHADRDALIAATLERAEEIALEKNKAAVKWASKYLANWDGQTDSMVIAQEIRALATQLQTDALAAVRREARAEGMRKAAKEAAMENAIDAAVARILAAAQREEGE